MSDRGRTLIRRYGIFLFVLACYIIFSAIINLEVICSSMVPNSTIIDPEYSPLYTSNYLDVMLSGWSWNSFLSEPTWGFDFLSYRLTFWTVGTWFDLNLSQIIAAERFVISLLTFTGAFLLARDYLSRYRRQSGAVEENGDQIVIIPAFCAGIVYGFSPSFVIGDSFWTGIQFAFATLPWILLTFNRAALDKKWEFTFLCALIISVNIDEHFLWAGFPLLILGYSIYLAIIKINQGWKGALQPVAAFTATVLFMVGLVAYRLISIQTSASMYRPMDTRASVDLPWMEASISNMLRSMSHMGLPGTYSAGQPWEILLNSLMPLTIIIPVLALSALVLYKKNWITLFFGSLIVGSILIFYEGSPFKSLHYWLFFNTPIGPAFRTWRIPDGFIALSISILLAFTLLSAFERIDVPKKRSFKAKACLGTTMIIIVLLLTSILSWPSLTGDMNGTLSSVEIPQDYLDAYSFLSNQTDQSRAIYVPDFTSSYGSSNELVPFWSTNGGLQEMLTYSSAKPTFFPIGDWGHYTDFTSSVFYSSLLNKGDVDALSTFLSWSSVEYVVIHRDIPAFNYTLVRVMSLLDASPQFEQVFHSGFIYIYKNLNVNEKVTVNSGITLINGGYRAAQRLLNLNEDNPNMTNNFQFIDQSLDKDMLDGVETLVTDSSPDQINYSIALSFLNEGQAKMYYPYDYTREYSPETLWSRASYMDSHQSEWHPFVNWGDYAWDFEYGKGVAFTTNSTDSMEIPLNGYEPGNYVIMVRYLASDRGGGVEINVQGDSTLIDTEDSYNGFLWEAYPMQIQGGDQTLTLKNLGGMNAISMVAVVPEQEYEAAMADAQSYVSTKQLIDLHTDKVANPSFERSLSGWSLPDSPLLTVQRTTSYPYDGQYSLSVEHNVSSGTIIDPILSDWIDVSSNASYNLTFRIRHVEANASSVSLIAYDEANQTSYVIGETAPINGNNTEWTPYTISVDVPDNVTKFRISLNPGLSNDTGRATTIWYDQFELTPTRLGDRNVTPVANNETGPVSTNEVNPTKYIIRINATSPFQLVLSETYNPNWVASIYQNGTLIEEIEPTPAYGIVNGYWINATGPLEIVLEHKPQSSIEAGYAISGATMALGVGLVCYCVIRRRRRR
jgi:hypothetical protein